MSPWYQPRGDTGNCLLPPELINTRKLSQLSSERLRCDQRSEASFTGSRLLGITWVSDHTQTSAELFTKTRRSISGSDCLKISERDFSPERCVTYIRDCHYLSSWWRHYFSFLNIWSLFFNWEIWRRVTDKQILSEVDKARWAALAGAVIVLLIKQLETQAAE